MKHHSHRLVAVMVTLVLLLGSVSAVAADAPANDDFLRTWERTDRPVSNLTVSRTWMWGPEAISPPRLEPYAEAPDGYREVQYFDKSRMEINDPSAPKDVWYVTNGLLVDELIRGRIQVGDAAWIPATPAEIPVAGDSDDTSGPTYAALGKVLDASPLAEGAEITWSINSEGDVSLNKKTGHGVTAAHYDNLTNHTIAAPFWTFMNSTGTVWENGANVNAKLFQDPFYATGRPITEAYWATVKVAGTPQDVLLQCFERRCLTYTPLNAAGWQVEAGNVGQHYYNWRYPGVDSFIYLVAEGDGGDSGQLIGCNDSLIQVSREVAPFPDPISAALETLFSIKERNYGESGLITAIYASSLKVDSVETTPNKVTVEISGTISLGGTCDEPRFIEQIRHTVIANADGQEEIIIKINGIDIDDLFVQGETQQATVYVVSPNDGGPVGCGDTLESWLVTFDANADPVTGALNALFALANDNLGESGFVNALHQPALVAVSAEVEGNHATVVITGEPTSGGACDDPRFVEQLRATVLHLTGADTATITVNGIDLDDLFDAQG
jgi:hypothetical protein